MREDLRLIAAMVTRQARVLDLGCGDGALLAWLQAHRGVNGYGLEIDAQKITTCLGRGVNVIERDIDTGLADFEANSFDLVVMTETLQAVRHPGQVLAEMLRIAPEGIVTFPNFGHWRCRLDLATRGRMPLARHLPHAWYDTPNIHLCTFADFEALCRERRIVITRRIVVDSDYRPSPLIDALPNLFGTIAIYGLRREIET
ncbi:MAG: methionine biosynthesis protein MetW [Pseudomonadales bacterium]|jgi:methionine biosynthesis protein MetW|nr:methionine biosynthesis protein MetW [Pseudomonadales bacterium]